MHTVATNNAAPVIAAGPIGPGRCAVACTPHLRDAASPPPQRCCWWRLSAPSPFLDSTIVNVAFPDIPAALPQRISDLSWMLNATYNIVFAAFLKVAAGRLATTSGCSSWGWRCSPSRRAVRDRQKSVGELVAFRVLQGIGAAVRYRLRWGWSWASLPRPAARAQRSPCGVRRGPSPRASARDQCIPKTDGWRWVFLVNLPLGVFAVLALGGHWWKNRAAGRRRVPDVRGAVLLTFALGALTLGLIRARIGVRPACRPAGHCWPRRSRWLGL